MGFCAVRRSVGDSHELRRLINSLGSGAQHIDFGLLLLLLLLGLIPQQPLLVCSEKQQRRGIFLDSSFRSSCDSLCFYFCCCCWLLTACEESRHPRSPRMPSTPTGSPSSPNPIARKFSHFLHLYHHHLDFVASFLNCGRLLLPLLSESDTRILLAVCPHSLKTLHTLIS